MLCCSRYRKEFNDLEMTENEKINFILRNDNNNNNDNKNNDKNNNIL